MRDRSFFSFDREAITCSSSGQMPRRFTFGASVKMCSLSRLTSIYALCQVFWYNALTEVSSFGVMAEAIPQEDIKCSGRRSLFPVRS
jgi:hypothetical protein